MWEETLQYISESYVSFSEFYDNYYLGWVVGPILFTVFLPALILIIFYIDIVIVMMYTWHWGQIRNAYGVSLKNGALSFMAGIWSVHSRLWHGYEIIGLDKIPKEDPALLVFYHGAIPVDHYYLLSEIFLKKSRVMFSIGDKFLFKMPGFKKLASAINVVPGSVQECVHTLKSGGLMAIYPGGVFESQFSDSNYKLEWRSRLGFAKVALEAKVPIIPIFTQNIREAFVALPIGKSFWMKLYAWTRLPLVPVIGEFPVKLRTFIGDPIPYENITPEELKLKVMNVINEMILKHQRLPGSIMQALLDRFRSYSNI